MTPPAPERRGLAVALSGAAAFALGVALPEAPGFEEPKPAATVTVKPTPRPTVTVTARPKPRPTRTVVVTRTVRASRSYGRGPTPAAWAALRHCESRGDYRAVSASGRYRGAYQFDLQTWRDVGGRGDPALASPAEQDMRARRLYALRGAAPWPVCGRHL